VKGKEFGIAVVGSGRIGTLRASLVATHPMVNFLAISDNDPLRARALAEKVGAQFYSSDNLEVISRPEVNAVIVSTSEHELHCLFSKPWNKERTSLSKSLSPQALKMQIGSSVRPNRPGLRSGGLQQTFPKALTFLPRNRSPRIA